jgi:hypothetical protein
MASDDENRRELFDVLEAGIGSRGAALLMSYLPPVGWAELATKTDLGVVRSEIGALRSELKGDLAELRGEMAELRGEMRSMVPKLWAANVATMIGISGLVFAVASFAR